MAPATFLPVSRRESEPGPRVEPEVEVRVIGGDAVARGQYDETIRAYRDDQLLGIMKLALFKHPLYTPPEGETTIQHVEVVEAARRRGVATTLFRYAQQNYPNLRHSMQTEEGAAWVRSLGKRQRGHAAASVGRARTRVGYGPVRVAVPSRPDHLVDHEPAKPSAGRSRGRHLGDDPDPRGL